MTWQPPLHSNNSQLIANRHVYPCVTNQEAWLYSHKASTTSGMGGTSKARRSEESSLLYLFFDRKSKGKIKQVLQVQALQFNLQMKEFVDLYGCHTHSSPRLSVLILVSGFFSFSLLSAPKTDEKRKSSLALASLYKCPFCFLRILLSTFCVCLLDVNWLHNWPFFVFWSISTPACATGKLFTQMC